MIDDEYFKKWLDDKFSHLEDKIDKIYQEQQRLKIIEDRFNILEEHKAKDDGMWRAYGKLATIGGGVVGGFIAWLTNKFL